MYNKMKYKVLFVVLFVHMHSFGDNMESTYLSNSMVLPSPTEIISVEAKYTASANVKLEVELKNIFVKSRVVKKNESLLIMWNYSPWCDIKLNTSIGEFNIRMFLGGLGFVKNNENKVVAVMFEL